MKRVSQEHGSFVLASNDEAAVFAEYQRHYAQSPLPPDEVLPNLGMFLTSKNLARILFFNDIYQMIVRHHGIVMEFGVRWGQTLSLLSALRGIYEPFNRHRKIVGFDTFCGFQGVSEVDGPSSGCKEGSFSVTVDYRSYLEKLMVLQEAVNPIAHLRKFELVEGDACQSVPDYLTRHPETIVSLAIFDFDIYQPTRAALEAIVPYLTKGSVLVFDELCDSYFPGETVALREVLGLRQLRIQRSPHTARVSYVVLD